MAVNMPLQGTAADIMKLALVKAQEYLDQKYPHRGRAFCSRSRTFSAPTCEDIRILLSIHDEIILETRNNMVKQVAEEVQEIMENVFSDIMPLKVAVKIGKNWGEI